MSSRSAGLPFGLFLAGIVILLATGSISFLSHQFIFGERHADRPILGFLLLASLAFLAYFLVFERLRKYQGNSASRRIAIFWILFVAVACRLLYFPSQPIQETDPYRYIWDGQSVLKSENPYALSPSDAFSKAGEPAAGMTDDMRRTFERINYPHIRTIYPPLAQGLFAAGQILSPWGLGGWRILIFTAELLTLLIVLLILKKAALPQEWIVLYAWSPLVLKEYSNSLHLDAFAVLFLCVMVYLLFFRRLILAFGFLAMAVLVKGFAVFLLPLLVAFTWGQGRKETFLGAAFFAGIMMTAYAPFGGAGASLFEGLTRFAVDWKVNEGLFGIFHYAALNLFSDSSFANIMGRVLSFMIVIGVVGIACIRVRGKNDTRTFCRASLLILAVLFFVLPAANPWYFTWLVPFFAFAPLRSLILFSGLVFLYYLDFYFMYLLVPEGFLWVRIVEYGLFYLVLGWEGWTKHRPLPLSYRLQTSGI